MEPAADSRAAGARAGASNVTTVSKMSPSPTEAHASERHQVTLRRLRWAAALSFAPITVSAVVNSIVFWSDRLAERLATHVVQAGHLWGGVVSRPRRPPR